MRRWDRLVDLYIEQYRARGIAESSVRMVSSRLHHWGSWLKQRRPRVAMEQIDAALLTRYIGSCSSFRAKSTVYGTLSMMRGFGDFLVRECAWPINPLRWMKGPKCKPASAVDQDVES